ncbi:MAG TPA: hypothetical protein VFA80_16060 [Xanthobacteraceae bacterium]|nr:hypothetical protein [Xanthobacteraceae bacterium]
MARKPRPAAKRKVSPRERGKAPPGGVLRVGKTSIVLDVLRTTCGTQNLIWMWPKPTPIVGIFVNLGICSIQVQMAGVGKPSKVMIPSRAGAAGAQILGHPAATTVTIDCLGTVAGGECVVLYLLIW